MMAVYSKSNLLCQYAMTSVKDKLSFYIWNLINILYITSPAPLLSYSCIWLIMQTYCDFRVWLKNSRRKIHGIPGQPRLPMNHSWVWSFHLLCHMIDLICTISLAMLISLLLKFKYLSGFEVVYWEMVGMNVIWDSLFFEKQVRQ